MDYYLLFKKIRYGHTQNRPNSLLVFFSPFLVVLNIVKHLSLLYLDKKKDQSTGITDPMNNVCPVSIGRVCEYQHSGTVRGKPVVFIALLHLFSITVG